MDTSPQTEAAHVGSTRRAGAVDDPWVLEDATRDGCADDYGHVVRNRPRGVLQPRSVDDVVRAVRFCRKHRIPLAARGQGHSTAGQAQVADGLVIDMRTLGAIRHIGFREADVEGGATWRELITASIPLGVAPPVLTGFTGLSVGGTLSMGGIGAASFRHGAQVDNALELDVVTGAGELRTCSRAVEPQLFNAVLGGVGQYGIIVRARVALQPVAPRARSYVLVYDTAEAFFEAFRALTAHGLDDDDDGAHPDALARFDGVYGQIVPGAGAAGWSFIIHAARLGDAPADDAACLRAAGRPREVRTQDLDALAHATLIDAMNAAVGAKAMAVRRVWSDLFVPSAHAEGFVTRTLARLTPEDLGPAGFILLFAVRRRGGQRAFRLPDADVSVLFDVLVTGRPTEPAFVATQLARARLLYKEASALGATVYPIGSTPMSPGDWAIQHGAMHAALRDAKDRYDPDGILAPGAGIF